MKKKIITIAGKPGSGKSTTSRMVAEALGYRKFSSGDLFRSIANERGIDVNNLNTVAEQEKEIDYAVDERLREIGAHETEVVIDSRMAWHWMPDSFRVYLELELDEAAKRIIANADPVRLANENIPQDPIAYTHMLQERLDSEIMRYQNLYNANPYDPSNYDLVVDTLTHNPQQVADMIVEKFSSWISS